MAKSKGTKSAQDRAVEKMKRVHAGEEPRIKKDFAIPSYAKKDGDILVSFPSGRYVLDTKGEIQVMLEGSGR